MAIVVTMLLRNACGFTPVASVMDSRMVFSDCGLRKGSTHTASMAGRFAGTAAAGRNVDAASTDGKRAITSAGFRQLDYLVVRGAETLGPYDPALKRPGRVLVAAWLGETRLIDKVPAG